MLFLSRLGPDCISYDLVPKVVNKHICARWNYSSYGVTDTHLKVWSRKHLGISPLILKRQSLLIKILFGTFFWNEANTLLLTNLLLELNKKYLLQLRESLLIKQNNIPSYYICLTRFNCYLNNTNLASSPNFTSNIKRINYLCFP